MLWCRYIASQSLISTLLYLSVKNSNVRFTSNLPQCMCSHKFFEQCIRAWESYHVPSSFWNKILKEMLSIFILFLWWSCMLLRNEIEILSVLLLMSNIMFQKRAMCKFINIVLVAEEYERNIWIHIECVCFFNIIYSLISFIELPIKFNEHAIFKDSEHFERMLQGRLFSSFTSKKLSASRIFDLSKFDVVWCDYLCWFHWLTFSYKIFQLTCINKIQCPIQLFFLRNQTSKKFPIFFFFFLHISFEISPDFGNCPTCSESNIPPFLKVIVSYLKKYISSIS